MVSAEKTDLYLYEININGIENEKTDVFPNINGEFFNSALFQCQRHWLIAHIALT